MYLLTGLLLIALAIWAFEYFYLRGGRAGQYPQPADPDYVQVFSNPQGPGQELKAVHKILRGISAEISADIRKRHMPEARKVVDAMSDGRVYPSEFLPVDAGGVPAEWVLAPGADANRRVLYIHGGGFVMGSPKSHRTITSRFSEVSGCAVLAIDYRLLPEHKHMDAVTDCRKAYHWILKNGPEGLADIQQLFISGDSAGGNLTLSLAAWIRDNGHYMPAAVVALSPLTDVTFSGESMRSNAASDVMLAPVLRILNRIPQFIKSWSIVRLYRARPADPVVSPLFGDLSGLPPTLVQASEVEMLLDDARRYVYKAVAAGSPVKLQTWSDMVHVWQIFYPELPQAGEAWQEIGKFIETQSR